VATPPPTPVPAPAQPSGGDAAARFLAGPAFSFAVLSLHVAALSSASATAEAVSLAVDRISAHLGPVKTSSRCQPSTRSAPPRERPCPPTHLS